MTIYMKNRSEHPKLSHKEPQKSFLIVEMEKKEHGDIHYTFTRLTKLKRRELVPF